MTYKCTKWTYTVQPTLFKSQQYKIEFSILTAIVWGYKEAKTPIKKCRLSDMKTRGWRPRTTTATEKEHESIKEKKRMGAPNSMICPSLKLIPADREQPQEWKCRWERGSLQRESHQVNGILKQNHPHSLEEWNKIQSPQEHLQCTDTFLNESTYREPENVANSQGKR